MKFLRYLYFNVKMYFLIKQFNKEVDKVSAQLKAQEKDLNERFYDEVLERSESLFYINSKNAVNIGNNWGNS